MQRSEKLAFVALLTAFRQSGIVDKRAVQAVADMLLKLCQTPGYLAKSEAADLSELVQLIESGPLKHCHITTAETVA